MLLRFILVVRRTRGLAFAHLAVDLAEPQLLGGRVLLRRQGCSSGSGAGSGSGITGPSGGASGELGGSGASGTSGASGFGISSTGIQRATILLRGPRQSLSAIADAMAFASGPAETPSTEPSTDSSCGRPS